MPIANRSTRIIVASNYMDDIKALKHRCKQLLEEIEYLRDGMGLHGMGMDEAVSHTSKYDVLGSQYAKYDEMIEDYSTELEEYRYRVQDCHQRLKNIAPQHSRVLTMHYVIGKDWREVADEMQYSRAGIMYLRRDALNTLYDYLPEEYRQTMPKAV